MATYTIRGVTKKEPFTTAHGTFQPYDLMLEDADKNLVSAQVSQKPESAEPTVGSPIEGTVEDSQYGKKFKRDRQGSFQSGSVGRARDPKTEARITRMHAQKCALSYAHLRQAQGKLPEQFELRDLFLIAAKFCEDVETVG